MGDFIVLVPFVFFFVAALLQELAIQYELKQFVLLRKKKHQKNNLLFYYQILPSSVLFLPNNQTSIIGPLGFVLAHLSINIDCS